MALPALADPADLAARLGVTLVDAQISRAYVLLDDASAAVRNYTRQDFTVITDTATLESTVEQWLYLPQRPVLSISSVVAGGATLAPGLWIMQNDALYRYDGWNSRFYGAAQPWNQPDTIVVTYTHGYAEIPADVVRVVCKLAERSWANPKGYAKVSMGTASFSLAPETIGVGGLDDDDRRVLDYYRRPMRSARLSARIL